MNESRMEGLDALQDKGGSRRMERMKACVRACLRGVHQDAADHFPRLHFHD